MLTSNIYLITGGKYSLKIEIEFCFGIGAGFIGSHLIDRLLGLNLGRVILLDNFNDYYPPILKQRNVEYLRERYPNNGNLIIVRGDINDQELLKMIFNQYPITHIAHLAVEYSRFFISFIVDSFRH